MEWNHCMTILLLDLYFKIKSWIYRGILGVLVKNSLNLIPFISISSNFGGMKIWDFKENEKIEWVFSSTHSIHSHLNSQIREWIFYSLH